MSRHFGRTSTKTREETSWVRRPTHGKQVGGYLWCPVKNKWTSEDVTGLNFYV